MRYHIAGSSQVFSLRFSCTLRFSIRFAALSHTHAHTFFGFSAHLVHREVGVIVYFGCTGPLFARTRTLLSSDAIDKRFAQLHSVIRLIILYMYMYW